MRAWIAQGAAWPDDPPGRRRPSLSRAERRAAALGLPQARRARRRPRCRTPRGPANPIDRFVLARLEKEGLEPSPEASLETLVRRVSLDLIGLPPTLAEVDAFLADTRPRRLRAAGRPAARPRRTTASAGPVRGSTSPATPTRTATRRTACATMWEYRDWVIDALNADMPFDRFTSNSSPATCCPNATPSQRIASGFHRNTMTNEEGGIDVEEARYEMLVDRVNTTGHGLARHDARLRAVPQPQVRPVHPEGLLPHARVLRERRVHGRGRATATRYIEPRSTCRRPSRKRNAQELQAEIERLERR